jgi:hypothetical protein
MSEGDVRATSRWVIWLHRIGYLTTVVVIVELGVIAVAVGGEWLRHRQISAMLVERSRTHEAPIREDGEPHVRGAAVELLARLPPLRALHGDGLRFVAMPSFGTSDYALALSLPPKATAADGVLLVIDKTSESRPVAARRFTAPAADYRKLVIDLDRLADGWPGDVDLCGDGAPAAFERVRGARITSGIGNCSPHYDKVKLLVLTAIRRLAPGPDLPTEDDWHRFEPEERARR